MLKRKLVIALAALAAVAFAGGAYAANQESGANLRQAFLNDVAKRLNVTPKQLSEALSGAAVDQLKAAVAAGRLTQAQADAIEKRIQQHGGLPPLGGFFLRPHRFGFLPGGPPGALGGPGGGPIAGPGAGPLGAAASYLGLSRAELFKQIMAGKSLAQIAKSKGKSVSGLEQAIVVPIKARLDMAVADKRITSAQEQRLLTRLSTVISRGIERGFALRPALILRFRGHLAFRGYLRFRGRLAFRGGALPGLPFMAVPPGGPSGAAGGPGSGAPGAPGARRTRSGQCARRSGRSLLTDTGRGAGWSGRGVDATIGRCLTNFSFGSEGFHMDGCCTGLK